MTGESVGDLCHDANFTGLKVGRLGVQVETQRHTKILPGLENIENGLRPIAHVIQGS